MAHHGWVSISPSDVAGKALQSPFGRLFPPARAHSYNSHAIALLAGALGPMHFAAQGGAGTSPKTKAMPAGFTFFGQFVDHDLTQFRVVETDLAFVERNPTIGQRQQLWEDPGGEATTTNGRTGRLDLDSVYGLFGDLDLALFDDDGRFRTRKAGLRDVDIQRDVDYRDGRLIADPRNDENKIVVQLHMLFERLHNQLHGTAAKAGKRNKNHDPGSRIGAILETRRKVVEIYRRIVLYDYLPRIADPAIVAKVWARIQENRSFYQQMNRRVRSVVEPLVDQIPSEVIRDHCRRPDLHDPRGHFLAHLVAMPVEFAHAAFRLGHSQVRNGYRLHSGDNGAFPLFATGSANTNAPTEDLRGNARIEPRFQIEWKFFFGGGDQRQNAEPIDTKLSLALFRLPPPSVDEPPLSLAERNILRGVDFGLPSGQEVARILDTSYGDVPMVQPVEIFDETVLNPYPELGTMDAGLAVTTPLWFYVLRESEILAPDKSHLGPVGSYIVAETLLGSLQASRGFDLGAAMADYEQKVEAHRTSPGDKDPDHICTMVHLLHFLGEDEIVVEAAEAEPAPVDAGQ